MKKINNLLLIVLVFAAHFCIAQEFKSVKELNQLLSLNAIQFEDSLIKKGFQFEKSEGNIFSYKKNASRIDFKMNPKEVTYSFTDRSFYLRTYSELETLGFKFIKAEEEIIVQNTNVKADHLSKDAYHVYLWNTAGEGSGKMLYAIKIQSNGSTIENSAQTKQDSKSKGADQILDQMSAVFYKTPDKTSSKQNIPPDSNRLGFPKLFRFNVSIGVFDFRDPGYPDNGFNRYPNYQIGFQKSRFMKSKPKKTWLTDAGLKMDLAYMPGLTYGPSDNSWYVTMWKIFLVYNQYASINLKYFDLVFQGGVYLNYNRGLGSSFNGTSGISAGYLDRGFHFGEHIQRGIGKSKLGYPKKLIGIGYDQYIDISGCYVATFGLSIGF